MKKNIIKKIKMELGLTNFAYKILFIILIIILIIIGIIIQKNKIKEIYYNYLINKQHIAISRMEKDINKRKLESIKLKENARIKKENAAIQESIKKDNETRALNERYKNTVSRKNYKEGTMVKSKYDKNKIGRVTEIQGLRCICGAEEWFFDVDISSCLCEDVISIGYEEYIKTSQDNLENSKYKLNDEQRYKINKAVEQVIILEGEKIAKELWPIKAFINYKGDVDRIIRYDGLILITKKGKRILATDKEIKKANKDEIKKYLGFSGGK